MEKVVALATGDLTLSAEEDDQSALQRQCWTLELTVQEMSETMRGRSVMANACFEQNAQLKVVLT